MSTCSLKTISEHPDVQNRLIPKRQLLRTLFQEVQRGHQAEIKIMRILLQNAGVFDESKEGITSGAGSMGSLNIGKTADYVHIGHGIRDHVNEVESPPTTASLPPIPDRPSVTASNSTSSRKMSGHSLRTAYTSFSSDYQPGALTKQSAGAKTVPLTVEKSKLQRQKTTFPKKKPQNHLETWSSKILKRSPRWRKGANHTNSHLEEKKEHGEGLSVGILSKNKPNIPPEIVSSSRINELGSKSLGSPILIEQNRALSEGKEELSPTGVLHEQTSETDDSESDVVEMKLNNLSRESKLLYTRQKSQKRKSFPINERPFANAKIEDNTRVLSDDSHNEDGYMKDLKPVCSDKV